MVDRDARITGLALTLILVAANVVALNYLLAGWAGARLDLTEEGLYSISPATERLLGSLDEDLTIRGYFSERTHPKLAPLVPEIQDLLAEYESVSRGRVRVEIVDPAEDEAAAQEAADRYGVQSTPFRTASKYETGIVNAFFALVIKYGDAYERYTFQDLIRIEPLPDGDVDVRLRNLEYDLTRAIKRVVFGFRSANELFERVNDPVRLVAILSPELLPEPFVTAPDAVRKAAEELGELGGDRFEYVELDPSVDEAARLEVETRYGLPPLSMGLFAEDSFYLYGILEIGDRLEQLILATPDLTAASVRESIENALRRNTPGFLKGVGVVSPAPPQLPPQLQMQMPQPGPEFVEIKRFLQEDYRVDDVDLGSPDGVPSDVDVLLVLKPTAFDEIQLYNLDQYLMRGGRVILCAGNYSTDFSGQGLNVTPLTTGIDDWLAHLGVEIVKTLVLDDRNQAFPLPEIRHTALGSVQTWVLAPYPYLVQVRDDGFVNPDITATLDAVGIYWGSPVIVDAEKVGDREILPILRSSDASWTSDDLSAVSYVDYEVPAEGTEPQQLAVALNGTFDSFFADRPVPVMDTGPSPAPEDGVDEEPEPPTPTTVALKKSPATRLVVIGDAAFLSDFVARTLGQVDGGFFVENLRFIENVIDWVSLDSDMLEIRARGLTSRRLERTSKRTQVTIEAFNYLTPAALLLAIGLHFRWRRRHTPARFAPSPPLAAPAETGKEA